MCAHGYSGNARDFDYLARALAADARVIAIDVAGRGESDWLGSPLAYHFGQFLADIHALLSDLELRSVDWVGTSMGGLLGLLLASEPASPVRRLVMNDIGAFVPGDALAAIGRNLVAPARFATFAEVEAHMRRTHRDWGRLDGERIGHYARHGSREDGDGFRLHYDPQIARLLHRVPFAPGLFFWDAWYRVRSPVLLMRGARSKVFPAAVAATMLDVKPGARLAVVPGVGHVPSLTMPGEIAMVRDFLLAEDPATWRIPSSSFPDSSRTPMRSAPRSSGSRGSRPAASPT